jgi:hypothetical protein
VWLQALLIRVSKPTVCDVHSALSLVKCLLRPGRQRPNMNVVAQFQTGFHRCVVVLEDVNAKNLPCLPIMARWAEGRMERNRVARLGLPGTLPPPLEWSVFFVIVKR